MKVRNKISTILLVLGLVVSVLTVYTMRYEFPRDLASQQNQVNEEEKDTTGDREVISDLDAVTSSPQVSLVHHFFLLDVITPPSEDEDESNHEENGSIYDLKVFKILFERIISPNAP